MIWHDDYGKNFIIISFTEQGTKLNQQLSEKLKAQSYACESYAVSRFAESTGMHPLPSDTKAWIGSLWGTVDFVFIGAAGIAVRYIAPWVEDKFRDSAVISIDEMGRFVIPLLSGHVGGGVELAQEIASCLGAVPVITTATDVQGRFAVDVFARKNCLHIGSRERAKQISAAVLEGKKIGFYSAYPVEGALPEEVRRCETYAELARYEYGIAVGFCEDRRHGSRGKEAAEPETGDRFGCRNEEAADDEKTKVSYLLPKDLILGIGCRKGVPYPQIWDAVQSVLKENGWKPEQIGALASIDLKREEPGIKELAKRCGVPFYTYPAEELQKAGSVSSGSAFVQSVTGVDNVCERAAKRCCMEGTILLPKVKLEQVTLAVVQRKTEIIF